MNCDKSSSGYHGWNVVARALICILCAAPVVLAGCQRVTEPGNTLPGRSAPRIGVAFDVPGPVLTLTSDYFDPIVSTGPGGGGRIVAVPAGAPIVLCWEAEPSEGAEPIDAYRYGWDILDLNDPGAWEVDFTPFDGSEVCLPSRQFMFGSHTFNVEVRDAGGARSRIGLIVNLVHGPQGLDILPKSCDNRFKPKGKGLLPVALPLLLGQDAGDIDLSTVEMRIGAEIIKPVKARVRDVTSLAADPCGCNTRGRDGVDDLVLKFPVDEITRALGPVSRGDQRMIGLSGRLHSGLSFDVADCIVIAGGPKPKDDALALRDGVLGELEAAYNNKNFDRVRRLFDDDFIFFFSLADINDGKVSVSQWDKASELAATASLFNVDWHKSDRPSGRAGDPPSRAAAVEEWTWGGLKAWMFDNQPADVTSIELSLLYPPGEGAWVQVIPDPVQYPGEVWYEKTVDYLFVVQAGEFTFLNAAPMRASFVVRSAAHDDDDDHDADGDDEVDAEDDDDAEAPVWRLVRWRDDI